MKGLFVALICAIVGFNGVYVRSSPLPPEVDTAEIDTAKVDTPEVDTAKVDSTVESTVAREAKALPVHGLRQGEVVNQQAKINPFLQNSQQHQTPNGGIYNQQLGVQPVGSHIQHSGGHIHQQLGGQPVGSHIQPSGGLNHQQLGVQPIGSHVQPSGGLGHQQLGVNPIGSHVQPSGGLVHQQSGVNPVAGGFINQQTGIKPVVGSSLQGGHIHQQSGVKPGVGSPLQGGLINQQLGVQPGVGSPLQGGLITQQQLLMNPFLQGSQQHQTPSPGLVTGQPGVNPFLPGTQQHHQHQIPSGVQISGGLVNQQTKVLPVDSQVHITDTDADTVTDKITSRNSQVHAEDSLNKKPVEILSQDSDVYPDGSHFNVWESANGIKVQEEGTVKVNGEVQIQSVQGSISYTDADGTPIHLTYIADENGFQPQGDHLPTPPPVPRAIARALEYIAAHPYVEEEYLNEPSKTSDVTHELPIVQVA